METVKEPLNLLNTPNPSRDEAAYTVLSQAGIKADVRDLKRVAANFQNDPLTLRLLAAYLCRWYAGRLVGIDSLPALLEAVPQGRPLKRVLAGFENKFAESSDLILLSLLSLTDHPVSQEALKLTFSASLLERWLVRRDDYLRFLAPLSRLKHDHWHWVIENLRRLQLVESRQMGSHHMLLVPEPIRLYFRQRLQVKNELVFHQASSDMERLFSEIVVPLREWEPEKKGVEIPDMLWRSNELDAASENLQALRQSLAALNKHSQRLQNHIKTLETN